MITTSATAIRNILINYYGFSNPNLIIPEDGLEGNTYIVASSELKYVVKVYHDNVRASLIAQFQHYLAETQPFIPKIHTNIQAELATSVGNNTIVLSEFMDGRSIGWNSSYKSLSGKLTKTLAVAVASMHVRAQTITLGPTLDHPLSTKQLIVGALPKLSAQLATLDMVNVRQHMIHGDLARENVFLHKSDVSVKSIIDFGDSHYDYVSYDLATLLTQIYITKTWGIDFAGIRQFMDVYTHINILNETELQAILPLMELRNRGLLNDIDKRILVNEGDQETLISIKESLSVKIRLLEQHALRLNTTLVQA